MKKRLGFDLVFSFYFTSINQSEIKSVAHIPQSGIYYAFEDHLFKQNIGRLAMFYIKQRCPIQ